MTDSRDYSYCKRGHFMTQENTKVVVRKNGKTKRECREYIRLRWRVDMDVLKEVKERRELRRLQEKYPE